MLTHANMSGVVQDSTLLFPLRFSVFTHTESFFFLNLKHRRSSSCATWTQATCQGLSACLATSTPCESSGASCSVAIEERFHFSLFLSRSYPAMTCSHVSIFQSEILQHSCMVYTACI